MPIKSVLACVGTDIYPSADHADSTFYLQDIVNSNTVTNEPYNDQGVKNVVE